MARKTEDIQLDIAEAKQLILTAKRPSNQAALAKHLSTLKSELEALAPQQVQPPAQSTQIKSEEPQKVQVAPSEQSQRSVSYTPLTKYSWDQENKKVKIYFSLDGIGQECKADQIDVKFQSQVLEIKIRDYRKSNLIFAIRKLCGPIAPEQCSYLVKTNMLSVTLIKKQSKHWSQLQYKQDALKEKKEEKDANPGDSIMNMMKKMYEEGDDNMKKTIAEAWTKAQDKKGGMGGGMDDLGGMGGMGGLGGMSGLGGMGGMGGMGDFGGFRPKK